MNGLSDLVAVAVIDQEADRLASVLADADPDAPCPTCPGWTAADLLWHLTEVHTFWSRILSQGVVGDEEAAAVDSSGPARPGTVAQMMPLRAAATEALVEQLSSLPDAEHRWTWWPPDQTVGFTRRMQVCEATMHRVDAELAAGVPLSKIAGPVATLAVDHCVDVMWGWIAEGAVHESLATAHLVATDSGDEWLVDVGRWSGVRAGSGERFDMARAVRAAAGAQPDVTVRGSAQQLALWAWGRGGDPGVEGTPDATRAVQNLIDQGIQ